MKTNKCNFFLKKNNNFFLKKNRNPVYTNNKFSHIEYFPKENTWIFRYNDSPTEECVAIFLADRLGVESLIEQKRKLDKCKFFSLNFAFFLNFIVLVLELGANNIELQEFSPWYLSLNYLFSTSKNHSIYFYWKANRLYVSTVSPLDKIYEFHINHDFDFKRILEVLSFFKKQFCIFFFFLIG